MRSFLNKIKNSTVVELTTTTDQYKLGEFPWLFPCIGPYVLYQHYSTPQALVDCLRKQPNNVLYYYLYMFFQEVNKQGSCSFVRQPWGEEWGGSEYRKSKTNHYQLLCTFDGTQTTNSRKHLNLNSQKSRQFEENIAAIKQMRQMTLPPFVHVQLPNLQLLLSCNHSFLHCRFGRN